MATGRCAWDRAGMAKVMIAVQRPASMSESELRTWIDERALHRRVPVALSGSDRSGGHALRLRVDMPEGSTASAEEELSDLMLDMRLLGLRPAIVDPDDRRGTSAP
jgi:hypothetical protein